MPGGIIPQQTSADYELPIGEKVAPQSTPSDFMSPLTLEAANQFHSALNSIQDTNEQMQMRQDQNWVSKTLMNTRLNFMGRISQMEADPGSAPSPQEFQQEVGNYMQKVSAVAPTGRAKDMLNNEMDQLTPRLMSPVFRLAARNAVAQRSSDIASTIDSGFDVAQQDPNQLPQIHAQLTQMLGNNKGAIPDTDYQAHAATINQMPAKVVDSVADNGNPAAAIGMLNHPLVSGTMTPDAIEAARTRYESSLGVSKKSAQAEMGVQANNAISALRDSGTFPAGFNPQVLAQTVTPKQYETFLDNAYVASTMHKNDATIQAAPLDQLTKMTEQLPTPEELDTNSPFLSKDQKVLTQTRDAIKAEVNLLTTDGHAAAMRDPSVSNFFAQGDALSKTDAEKTADPLSKAMELVPGSPEQAQMDQIAQSAKANQLYQQGFQASIAYQAAKGVPPELQKVMSKSDAIDQSNSIMKANNFQDVSKALSDMQTKFGPSFPQAVAQMHALPGSNSLPAGIGLVAANLDQPFAETLFNAIKTPEGGDKDDDAASFASQFKSVYGNTKNAAAIDTAVSQNDTISNLRDVLKNGNSGDAGARYMDDMQTSVSKMAKYLMLNPPAGKTYTPQQASDLAASTVLSQHVAFPEVNGVKFLVPRDPSPNQHYDDTDLAHIEAGMQHEVENLSGRFFGADKTPQDIARGNGINSGAYWVTSPDNQGAYLFRKADDQRIITNQGIQLFDGANKPVYRSFEDMRQQGILQGQLEQQRERAGAMPPGAIFQG